MISEYADGNRQQVVGLCFEGTVTGGSVQTSDESSRVAFVPIDTLDSTDIMEPHRALLDHVLSGATEPFFRFAPIVHE